MFRRRNPTPPCAPIPTAETLADDAQLIADAEAAAKTAREASVRLKALAERMEARFGMTDEEVRSDRSHR